MFMHKINVNKSEVSDCKARNAYLTFLVAVFMFGVFGVGAMTAFAIAFGIDLVVSTCLVLFAVVSVCAGICMHEVRRCEN